MSQNLKDLTNLELLKHIEDEYGVKLPPKTNRTEIFTRLKELSGETEPTAPGDIGSDSEASGKGKKKLPKNVVLTIHEDDDPRNYVLIGFNGRNYQIKKGEPVQVPYGVYEILNNAVEDLYKTLYDDNGRPYLSHRKKHRHPFSVDEKVYD